jgi:Holliday junction resolvase RusA-like endonuclease
MTEQIIIIPGKPIAKKRPRFARRGKFTVAYSDQETEEGRTLWEIRQQWSGPPLDCPVKLFILALFPITKTSIKKVEAMLSGETKHVKKPDADNIQKFYMDVFNGTVWKDDSQVWKVEAEKGFSRDPQTIIRVVW